MLDLLDERSIGVRHIGIRLLLLFALWPNPDFVEMADGDTRIQRLADVEKPREG